MSELIRRLLLAAGIAGCVILAGTTVPALVVVTPVDFAAEMARKYRAPAGPRIMGAMELGKEFIRQTTKPGSLQEYINRVTEHRLLEVNGPAWEEFYGQLQQGAAGPHGGRYVPQQKAFVFRWEETPLTALQTQIDRMSQTWTVNYLVLRGGPQPRYLEVRSGYGFEPRNLGAPAGLVFPWRSSSWLPLLGGLAGFFLWPRRRRQPDDIYAHYVGSSLGLDLLGFLFFTLFFALPFWVSDPTQDMWGEDLGVTILFWLAALGALGLIVWSAKNASRVIRLEPGGLIISGLLGSRRLGPGEIARTEPLLEGGIESGIILHLRDGGLIKLPWHTMANFATLLDFLHRQGLAPQTGPHAPRTEL